MATGLLLMASRAYPRPTLNSSMVVASVTDVGRRFHSRMESSCRWTTWQLTGKVCADLWCVCPLGELHQCLPQPIRAVFWIAFSIGPLFFCVVMTPIRGLRPSWRRNQVSCHETYYGQNERFVFELSPVVTYSLVDWSHAGEAYSRVGLYGTVKAVWPPLYTSVATPQEFKGLWCFGCRRIHMSMSREAMADVHSEVLSTIRHFECTPGACIQSVSLQLFMMTDPDNLALLWVELHQP